MELQRNVLERDVHIEDYELPVLVREISLHIISRKCGKPGIIDDLTVDKNLGRNAEFLKLVDSEITAIPLLRGNSGDPNVVRLHIFIDQQVKNLMEAPNKNSFYEFIRTKILTSPLWSSLGWRLVVVFFDFVSSFAETQLYPLKHCGQLVNITNALITSIRTCLEHDPMVYHSFDANWISITTLRERKATKCELRQRLETAFRAETDFLHKQLNRTEQEDTTPQTTFTFADITREIVVFHICQEDPTPGLQNSISAIPGFDTLIRYHPIFLAIQQRVSCTISRDVICTMFPTLEADLELCETFFYSSPKIRYHFAVMRVLFVGVFSKINNIIFGRRMEILLCLFYVTTFVARRIKENTCLSCEDKIQLYQALCDAVYYPLVKVTHKSGLDIYNQLLDSSASR